MTKSNFLFDNVRMGDVATTKTQKTKVVPSAFTRMGLLALFLIIIGVGQAWADTDVVTFNGVSGTTLSETETNGSTSWTANGGQSIAWVAGTGVKISLGNGSGQGTAYVQGVIPADWKVTSVSFGGTNATTGMSLTVNGTAFTKGSNMTFTHATGVTGGPIVLTFTGTNANSLVLTTVTITFTSGDATPPVLTWPATITNVPLTSTFTISSNEKLWINRTTEITTALLQSEVTLYDEALNPLSAAITFSHGTNTTTLTVTPATGVLKNCATYTIAVSALLTDAAGNPAEALNRDWEFKTPTETIALQSGKTTFFVGETFSTADWVVTANGTNVTSECTFSNPGMATAGTKAVTVTHGACTGTINITVNSLSSYNLTWVNNVTGEASKTTTATQNTAIGSTPTPATTSIATDCGDKVFVGWSATEITTATDTRPTMVTGAYVATANATFYAVYADAAGGSGDLWTLVTNASELSAGMTVLIVANEQDYAMSTAKTNNFSSVACTKSGNNLTSTNTLQSLTLSNGVSAGTWAFSTGSAYLYAASSASNYLRTLATVDVNTSWTVTITDGVASIVATGSSNRNVMQFNNSTVGNFLFSCYATASQKPLSLYKSVGGTGFITECNCTTLLAPTGLNSGSPSASKTMLSWTAVANASSYTVYYRTDQTTWLELAAASNSVELAGLTKNTTYYWKVVAHGTGAYCANSTASASTNFITPSNCAWQINYQTDKQTDTWATDNCFTQVGTSTEWQIDFTMPATDGNFWVGPGVFGTYSKTMALSNITLVGLQATSCSKPSPGENAVGKLRIYSDSGADNYYVAFIPTYQITYGVDGGTDAWTKLDFAWVSGTKYETALQTVPAEYNTTFSFYVGPKTAGNTNWIAGKSSTVNMNTMGGLTSANMAGKRGVYRMYDDSCADNWYCAFIPYYDITYMAADGTTVFETSDAVPSDGDATARTVTVTLNKPVKTGYRFLGWATTSSATTPEATYAPGASVTLAGYVTLYPVFVQQVVLTHDYNGGTGDCENVTVDINTAATICTTTPTRTGYVFDGWSTTKDDATTKTGTTITLTQNTTIYALWQKIINVVYNLNGLTLAAGCEASTPHQGGDAITLCGTPTSNYGYTFEGWIVNDNGSTSGVLAAGATYTILANPTEDVTITAQWDVPDRDFLFYNQGMGEEGAVLVATVKGPDGTYVTTPATVAVPTNCEGKLFVGWSKTIMLNDQDYAENPPADFVLRGGKILVEQGNTEKYPTDGNAWGTWYAVFADAE